MHYLLLTGNVGADAEIRQNGQDTITNFRLAVNERFTTRAGVPQERTTWYSLSAFNVNYGHLIRQGRRMFVLAVPQEHRPFQRRDNSWDISNDARVMFAEFQDAGPTTRPNAAMSDIPANAQFVQSNQQTQVDQYRMEQAQQAEQARALAAMAAMAAAEAGGGNIPNAAPGAGLSVELPPSISTNPMIEPENQPVGVGQEDLPY